MLCIIISKHKRSNQCTNNSAMPTRRLLLLLRACGWCDMPIFLNKVTHDRQKMHISSPLYIDARTAEANREQELQIIPPSDYL